MVITSGRVVSGKIVVDGEPLPDGAVVTVLAREGDETFELDATAEAELLSVFPSASRGVRRIPLSRVSYHLFYRMVETPIRSIQVVALWHSSCATGPRL